MARSSIERQRLQDVRALPRFTLEESHAAGGQILASRAALIQQMPRGGAVAELGVATGDFSAQILSLGAPETLHLVDIWCSSRYGEESRATVEARFEDEIRDGRVIVHRRLSTDAATDFEDGYFSWVYLDTSHDYNTVVGELRAYAPKVKDSGFIAGHDYVMGNPSFSVKYGVIEAVAQFCVEEGWRIAYWTADFTEGNSFAITRS